MNITLHTTNTWHRYSRILMKLPICGSFGNRLNGSDIETREFILKSKSMGKKTKSKDFISKFYNSTENAYHCQHRQISIYGDSTFTQGNQMFYIALETSITFFSFMETWPRDHKILKSYYHLWIFFWKPTFSKPKK